MEWNGMEWNGMEWNRCIPIPKELNEFLRKYKEKLVST